MRFFKLLFVIVTTLYVGTAMFLHGFSAWRDGETVVRHRGKTPFTAMSDGPFPITFATEVWGFMILGAAVALAGVAGIVRLIFIAPARQQEALARMDDFTLRDRRGEKIPVWAAMAIIGGVVAFFLYLAFRVRMA